ncbi:MAG: hypothetical protein K2O21_00885 [Malacoplasma sp.]|nr:hypothetical protein [Malacoplasma sp.]
MVKQILVFWFRIFLLFLVNRQ